MLKLIRLEYKKNKIGRYVRNAAILTGILLLFFWAFVYMGIANDPDTGVPDAALGAGGVTANVELITGIAYMIFAAAMHASFIITAYKDKTMGLMFTYPIKRKKILAAKMLATWLFCTAVLAAAKLLVYASIFAGSFFLKPAFAVDYSLFQLRFYPLLLLKSCVTISVSFLALFVGMLLKSSKAALVASFLLIILMQGNIGDASLAGNMLLPIILAVISLLSAVVSIQRVEYRDVW